MDADVEHFGRAVELATEAGYGDILVVVVVRHSNIGSFRVNQGWGESEL